MILTKPQAVIEIPFDKVCATIPIATLNVKHFERIEGLELKN